MITSSELCRVAELVAKMFFPSVETVVHDLQKPGFPIVAIYNNILSGREVGATTSVFGPLDSRDDIPDHVTNYTFVAPNGREFQSSSVVFRDAAGSPEFALSINFDRQPIRDTIDMLSQLVAHVPEPISVPAQGGKAFLSQGDLRNEILRVLMMHSTKGAKLRSSELRLIIRNLDRIGFFDHHGAVSVASNELGVTRPTIYKYLKEDSA